MKTTASFEISHLQYLDDKAKAANKLPKFAEDPEVLKKLWRDMHFLRELDRRAVAMQRIGKMRTYPASLGQEAVGIGAGSCLTEKDVLVPYYRSTGAMLMHGVKPHEILLYWGGDERGCDYQDPLAKEDFPIAVPIATQILHAAGIAVAIKLRKQKGRAVLTEIGEGGTSEGEFYEGLNAAGAMNLPFVCVINNNQWAISVPPELQTAAQTFAQKGIAAGLDCLQVDGNDIIAVKDAVGDALIKARKGGGPTLIEAICYRLSDHTTADDASRYHDQKVHDAAWQAEPLKRLSEYLIKLGAATGAELDKVLEVIKTEVDREVKLYLDIIENRPQPPEAMFDYLYQTLPVKYASQREEVIKRGGGK
ncbi:MAG: thiamine pyrophosphate-dependent dehydrogenase E1 component subunit alpha [Proteobacteria bacterium]|nr:thiamine pyrophosphate-dependent dehydrogenase E1 component subunit alpha [Pseudomonadota bacterium]